jgi:hypothetical protein
LVISVALKDNIAIIGKFNGVHVFAPSLLVSSSSCTPMAKLTVSTSWWFGWPVAVAQNWNVVGARLDDQVNGSVMDALLASTITSTSSSS